MSRTPDPSRVWIDGAVVPSSEARVPVLDRGFLYGDSIYEVTRTFGGRPFALEEHLQRLARSATGLGMAIPDLPQIGRAIAETAAACRAAAPPPPPELYLRIVVTRGAGPIGLDPGLADAPRLVVMARPVEVPPPAAYATGVEVAIVARSRAAPWAVDPRVKSGNYLPSVLAAAQAKRQGAYESILCDSIGRLTEGGSSNLFLVGGGRLRTPPVSAGLLEGITRAKVIEAARADGLAVDELPLWPIDLKQADEAFITSSVRGVLPVVRESGAPIGDGTPGPVTLRVMALYDRLTGAAPA